MRLLFRRATGTIPTGIDRVGLEYVRHYAPRARAVLSMGPLAGALSQADSARMFRALLEGHEAGRHGFTLMGARMVAKNTLSGWIRPRTGRSILLNTAELWKDSRHYAAQLRWLGARPVFFIHDLIPISHPEYFRRGESGAFRARIRNALTLSRGIVVNSRVTQAALERHAATAGLRCPPVVVAPLAPSVAAASAPAGPPSGKPYFVCVGTIEPRKNHVLLLHLWRRLIELHGDAAPRLQVIGKRGWECENVVDLLERCDALKGFVFEDNACSDAKLATILHHARAADAVVRRRLRPARGGGARRRRAGDRERPAGVSRDRRRRAGVCGPDRRPALVRAGPGVLAPRQCAATGAARAAAEVHAEYLGAAFRDRGPLPGDAAVSRFIPASVLITGATGGIGSALAEVYAAPAIELILHGRDEAQLDALAVRCRALGAGVRTHALDLRDRAALRSWLAELAAQVPIDLAIVNAGVNIHIGRDGASEPWGDVERLLEVNVLAALATVDAVLPAMRARRRGQIALVSSLAAWHGLPLTPSYSASKAALKAYGEGIRGWLAAEGIGVSVVMPGYVESRMCREMPGPKPFLWSAERAARAIRRGLERDSPRISFPFPLNLGAWLLAVLPERLSQRLLARLGYRKRR